MAGGTFRLEDVHHVVDTVLASAQYPLADAAALETALGGGAATVSLGAEKHQASEVRQIPAEYFPIESAEDLFTKLANLRAAGGDQADGLRPVKSSPAPPGATPPQPPPPPSDVPTGGNVPFVRVVH